MDNSTGYIKIHSGLDHDVDKLYKVEELRRSPDSWDMVTAVVQHADGPKETRIIPHLWIEWIDDGDW